MNPLLITFLQQATPDIVAYIQAIYRARHPTQPPLTSEEVLAHWDEARATSLRKDDAFRAEGS
jgi:hypothetical protein